MKLLVLPGDGIGPEITEATLAVLQAASERYKLNLTFEHDVVGHAGIKAHGATVRPEIIEKARAVDGVVLGPTSTFEFKDASKGEINPSMYLRKNLDRVREFVREHLLHNPEASVLVVCESGRDLSVGALLAILCLFYDDEGGFPIGCVVLMGCMGVG